MSVLGPRRSWPFQLPLTFGIKKPLSNVIKTKEAGSSTLNRIQATRSFDSLDPPTVKVCNVGDIVKTYSAEIILIDRFEQMIVKLSAKVKGLNDENTPENVRTFLNELHAQILDTKFLDNLRASATSENPSYHFLSAIAELIHSKNEDILAKLAHQFLDLSISFAKLGISLVDIHAHTQFQEEMEQKVGEKMYLLSFPFALHKANVERFLRIKMIGYVALVTK